LAAKLITAVRTRRVKGVEEVTHLGASSGSGELQWMTVREATQAIEAGERYFIQIGSESLLISVQKNADGRKTVGVGFEPGAGRLLSLPRARG
jgi:hypothetical protein